MKKRINKYGLMKKNNFVDGAFIATLGIVISKVMGILYVIPFYSIIGEKGGALYGYAYTIYLLFILSLPILTLPNLTSVSTLDTSCIHSVSIGISRGLVV